MILTENESSEPLWVARYNGPANGEDEATAIAVDNSGNVYVTGGSDGDGTVADYTTIKYDPDSNEPVWVARYNGPENGQDYAEAIAVDGSGNVYAAGCSYGSGTDYDYTTIKYSPPVCTSPVTGDLNDDCKVDFKDFAIVGNAWLEEQLWP